MSTTPNDPNQPGSNDPSQGGPSYGSAPSYGDTSTSSAAPQYGQSAPAYGAASQPAYGASQPAYGAGGTPAYGSPAGPSKALAIAALVLGVLALLGSWIPVLNIGSILFGIVGAVLGAVALSKISRGTASGRGMALGGLITSILAIIISIIVLVAVGSLLGGKVGDVEACSTLPVEEQEACLNDVLNN